MSSRILFVSTFTLVLAVACKDDRAAPATTTTPPTSAAPAEIETRLEPAALGMFAKLPESMPSLENPITDAKVSLGRLLYFEKRISKNQDISCNSCHALDKFGVDGSAFSDGHRNQKGGRNSPTVYNAAGHIAQFWDGRAPDVEKQAQGPVLNPVEMAMPSGQTVLAVLKSMPEYLEAFRQAFPGDADPITFDNFGRAIGAFERGLLTPSRWDEFLGGNASALTAAEKKGVELFIATGCTACHSGAFVGGASFQKLGAVKPWQNQKDLGRYEITKQEADKMSFKVAALRNVARTAPYFHDGSAATLPEAVSAMAEHQLGKKLSAEEVAAIVTFLETLTGNIPAKYVEQPALPKSTARTPKPNPN